MADSTVKILWPNRSNYALFAQTCGVHMPASFEEFANITYALIEANADRGIRTVKVAVDPRMMRSWLAREKVRGGDEGLRAYAEYLFANGATVLG